MLDIASVLEGIRGLPESERLAVLKDLEALHEKQAILDSQNHFLPFVKLMWPSFIAGRHHEKMADAFERVERGELKRLIINMPPRHTKSEFASYLLPAWFLGKHPAKKIIQTSHTGELSVGFGRKVRNLIQGEDFQNVFKGIELSVDSKAAGRWNTNKGGDYFAVGIGGAVTGKGADLLIIDDPHALHLDTPVATTEGWKTIGSVEVGDEVFGPDGKPTKVVAKSGVYEDRDLYAVTTYDGETIYSDAKHLWNVRTSTRVNDPYRNLKSEDLVGRRSSPFMIPRHKPVEYPEQDLLVDPWVMGAWLGDGTSSLGRITAHPADMPYMRGEFESVGYTTTDLKDEFSFGVLGLRAELGSLGLLNNKHIPEEYLIGSKGQRLRLLQGLMDTDGNVTQQGQCVFHNKNKSLVDQVVELLRSLGRKCQRRSYMSHGKFGSCLMHRVTFKMKDAARMPRKRQRTRDTDDKQHRSISVEKTNKTGPVQCITVARKDGLFLAGRGYVVTHNSEQDAAQGQYDPKVYDKVYEWYTSGPRQRLQPGGSIVIVATRWSKRDLTGQVVQKSAEREGSDQWEVIELPAILPSGKSLWPEFWGIEELSAIKAEISVSKWNAQYQQNPTSEEGAIIKREWWKEWPSVTPPPVEGIIQSWDTAFLKTQRSDYSACTTWGIFHHESEDGIRVPNLILLDAYKEKLEFPELKREAHRKYWEFEPDQLVVEKKASGAPLIAELRMMGIPVTEFTPVRGNDKIARANAVADLFASGVVWYPPRKWADDVIEECASFPSGDHDDYVDSTTQALIRFRQGGWLRTSLDDIDDDPIYQPPVEYY